jgi:TolB-like protein
MKAWALSLAVTFVVVAGVFAGTGAAAPGAETARATAPPGVTIGVLYFDYAGRNAELAPLSKGLAQMLISDLTAVDTLRVVERERLQAVLDEQNLGKTGAAAGKAGGKIDPASAARIGKLLGARYLVLGSYFDTMGAFRADARLVDVETGQIVKAVGASGKAEDFIGLEQTLADGLCKAAAQLVPPTSSSSTSTSTRPRALDHPSARKPPKPPRVLRASTALLYSRALAAADGGDRKQAHALFKTVLAEQPDFELAQRDLDRLIQ